ncbi:hypothetical protein WDZ92_47485 [Nostoc sp. NIES-2111]
MIIMLPTAAELAAGVLHNVVPITGLLMTVLVVLVVLTAVGSRRPGRQGRSARLLDRVLTAISSVAAAAVSMFCTILVVVAAGVARPAA